MSENQATAPAGWYDDRHGNQRWWDGTDWTQQVRPAAPDAPAAVATLSPGQGHDILDPSAQTLVATVVAEPGAPRRRTIQVSPHLTPRQEGLGYVLLAVIVLGYGLLSLFAGRVTVLSVLATLVGVGVATLGAMTMAADERFEQPTRAQLAALLPQIDPRRLLLVAGATLGIGVGVIVVVVAVPLALSQLGSGDDSVAAPATSVSAAASSRFPKGYTATGATTAYRVLAPSEQKCAPGTSCRAVLAISHTACPRLTAVVTFTAKSGAVIGTKKVVATKVKADKAVRLVASTSSKASGLTVAGLTCSA